MKKTTTHGRNQKTHQNAKSSNTVTTKAQQYHSNAKHHAIVFYERCQDLLFSASYIFSLLDKKGKNPKKNRKIPKITNYRKN
jgi:hypothetical protein